MTFAETSQQHAEGWKTGFCQCDWCKASRLAFIDQTGQSPFDLDQEEARANQENWWKTVKGD